MPSRNRNTLLTFAGAAALVTFCTALFIVQQGADVDYWVNVARFDAPLGVPGTNAQSLAEAVERLALAQHTLAQAQSTPEHIALIRHLYPIAFLRAVAALEAKRQQLLAEPTPANAQAYKEALAQVRAHRDSDLDAFADAFSQATGADITIAGFGGLISRNSQLRTLFALQDDADEPTSQRIPTMAPLDANTIESGPSKITDDILALWDMAYGTTTDRTTIVLSQSSCLASIPGPHTITLATRTPSAVHIRYLSYAEDLFFTDTRGAGGSFAAYARDTVGVRYMPVTPFSYYQCPQLGIDFGTAIAIENIAAFARAHPNIAPAERAALLNPPYLSELLTRAYLTAAFAATLDEPTRNSLNELSLMYTKRTGGLEHIINDIAHIATIDAELIERGRFTDSVRGQFLTHSAFPTFFRIGATNDAALASLYLSNRNTAIELPYIRYSTLRTLTDVKTLAKDMHAYLRLENRLDPTVPATIPTSTDTRQKSHTDEPALSPSPTVSGSETTASSLLFASL